MIVYIVPGIFSPRIEALGASEIEVGLIFRAYDTSRIGASVRARIPCRPRHPAINSYVFRIGHPRGSSE